MEDNYEADAVSHVVLLFLRVGLIKWRTARMQKSLELPYRFKLDICFRLFYFGFVLFCLL